ncbi:DUF4886 domain-containing protein [Alloiococcus sp. CFN-8]|uniref:DUF4886 domain-containing protein n=1 Tax=Alloiococcus sp. CFN-8 TaxID=3416081 RepID=UPI003CEA6A76
MKILAIGNSFSEDATKYLHQIAEADAFDLEVVNLYIPGCCLEAHWNNILTEGKSYEYSINGEFHGRMVSIKEVLLEDKWDYITLQQCSGLSGIIESYYPYIKNISDYLRELSPISKLVIHETWAYEVDSTHGDFKRYNNSQDKMYNQLKKAYYSVAEEMGLPIIPSGDLVQKLRGKKLFDYENGGLSLCRDGYHIDLIYGRYLVAALWYKFFSGRSLIENVFTFEEEKNVDMNLINEIKNLISEEGL